MVKFEIEVKNTRNDSTIIRAEVKNGNWKYWDNLQESEDMESITINTIGNSYYLNKPVTDFIDDYDHEIYHETGELVKIGELGRMYDSLIEYLNCRIENVRESYFNEREFNFQLKDCYNRLTQLKKDSDLDYKHDADLKVIIKQAE